MSKKQYLSAIALPILLLVALISGCAGGPKSASTGQHIDDATITTKVKTALIGDSDVSALNVNVDTFKGKVQLSGFVDSESAKQHAEQDARSVAGVQSVENKLTVKGG